MGCCFAKGPVKVVPDPNIKNSVSDKNNSEKAFNSEERGQGIFGASHVEDQEITNQNQCTESTSFKKKDNEVAIARDASQDKNNHLKDKRQLPSLVKTSGYKDVTQKPVAFDVIFADDNITLQSTPRRYPRKLKKLEGVSYLTAEMLQQKQEQAEQNRCKELQKKTETTSKHRRNILKAKEFERSRNAENQLQAKLLASERKRQIHVEGIIDKQKRREQKAREVCAKSAGANETEDSLVHVDETYNSDGSQESDAIWEDDLIKQTKTSFADLKEDATSSIDGFFETGPQEQSLSVT